MRVVRPRIVVWLVALVLLQLITHIRFYIHLIMPTWFPSEIDLPFSSRKAAPGGGNTTKTTLPEQDHTPHWHDTANLTRPLRGHPHVGARDEHGHFGYVHDPTILHRSLRPFVVVPEEKPDLCAPIGEGPEGGGNLSQTLFGGHIQVATSTHGDHDAGKKENVKIFCAVYSYPGNNDQTEAVRSTWGKRCDGFMIASTETNHSEAIVNLPHAGGHQGQYRGIWQKVRSMLAYMYDNFLEDYDFFFLSGDDTYLIVENLKAFLTSSKFVKDAGGPGFPNRMFVGHWRHPFWLRNIYGTSFVYMDGGSGYVLSRSTLKAFVERVLKKCEANTKHFSEDVFMAHCLRQHMNVRGYDARDEQERERFIPYDLVKRVEASRPSIFGLQQNVVSCSKTEKELNVDNSFLNNQIQYFQFWHNFTAKYGVEGVSSSLISFHMVQPAVKMRRYERLLYRIGPGHEEEEQKDCEGYIHTKIEHPHNMDTECWGRGQLTFHNTWGITASANM